MLKHKTNKKSGITLIALVVTIIVLLILAGISISMLSGDNGILQRAATAKTETEIGQEKEIIALAYNASLAKKRGDMDLTQVTAQDLNPDLTKQGATADGSSPIKVTFNASKRQYTINNGSIEYAGTQGEVDEIVPEGKVARIGTTYYETLQNAFNAVTTDNTQTEVILLANISENVLVRANQSIILNLNNKTITNTEGTATAGDWNQAAIEVQASGIVEINSGTVESSYGLAIENYGIVSIGNGNISSTSYMGSIVNMGTLTINGGTISSTNTCVSNFGTMNIAGGTITTEQISTDSGSGAILNGEGEGALYITGGTITAPNTFAIQSERWATVEISGNVQISSNSCVGFLNQGNASISSGTFSSYGEAAVHSSGKITITGGTYTSTESSALVIGNGNEELTISGGTFTSTNGYSIDCSMADLETVNIGSGATTNNGIHYSD